MKCSIDGVVFGELCLQPMEAVCRGSLAFDREPFLQGYTIEGVFAHFTGCFNESPDIGQCSPEGTAYLERLQRDSNITL